LSSVSCGWPGMRGLCHRIMGPPGRIPGPRDRRGIAAGGGGGKWRVGMLRREGNRTSTGYA
ncbi:MAG: hypothetical protein KDA72_19985, partial [Planctomycetales bacterium]|nr:hypothetical protein [Planctomycetales bacterium]